jgi:hypothetical protein
VGCTVGVIDGKLVGNDVGKPVGTTVGTLVGFVVVGIVEGKIVGTNVECLVGISVGTLEGKIVDNTVGTDVSKLEGEPVGTTLGLEVEMTKDGATDGTDGKVDVGWLSTKGASVGPTLGHWVNTSVAEIVGSALGTPDGTIAKVGRSDGICVEGVLEGDRVGTSNGISAVGASC